MSITIFPCALGSAGPAPNQCVDEATYIDGQDLMVLLTKYSFDPENKSSPIKLIPYFDSRFVLETTLTTTQEFFMSKTEIYDDDLDFIKERKKFEYSEIDYIIQLTNSRVIQTNPWCDLATFPAGCNPYAYIQIKSGGKSTKIKRTYKKVMETFGELGGFVEIAVAAMALIYMVTKCNKSEDKMREELLKSNN
jgi:hypothetical protein